MIVFTFFGRYLLTCIVGQRRGAAGHVESRRGLPRGKSRLLLCNKNSLVLPTSAQLFFVGAGLRARPQDFSKDNTGSGKNGKIALPARFHSALARGGAAYANSVHAGACLSPTIKVVTGLKESR